MKELLQFACVFFNHYAIRSFIISVNNRIQTSRLRARKGGGGRGSLFIVFDRV